MTNYQKGRYREYRCRDYLRELGYFVVRSAGSKTAADIIAISENDVLVIQVKSKGEAGKKAVEKLKAQVPKNPNITRQVWEYIFGKWNVYWTD